VIPEGLWQALLVGAQAMSPWEGAAVVLGIAYLLLAMRESLWCWYAGFASTAIFLVIFWDVGLLMESGLQVYYLAMSVYGWWHWRQGATDNHPLPIQRWTPTGHVSAVSIVMLAAAFSGYLLSAHTDAALPYLDSFTTWGSILTTWMVARKVLENWLYWLVIDSVSIYLYLDRELYLTALLFGVYLVIALFGFIRWRQHYQQQFS
jgi:nicotinamide mononucleotide transporter